MSRDNIIKFTVNSNEKARIEEAAKGCSMKVATFCRAAVLSQLSAIASMKSDELDAFKKAVWWLFTGEK